MYGIEIRNLMKNKGSKGDRVTQTVRGEGVGFEVAVGQQGGAATRIAPHLPGFTSARG